MAEQLPKPYAAIALAAIVLSIVPIALLEIDGMWVGLWGLGSMWAAMILGPNTLGYLESLRSRNRLSTRRVARLNRLEVWVVRTYEGARTAFSWLMEMTAVSAICAGVLVACGGVLLIGTQCYFWLMEGQWQRSSAIELVELFNPDWARYPDTWKGLWKVIDLVPQSLVWLVVGCFVTVVSAAVREDLALSRRSRSSNHHDPLDRMR